MNTNPITRFGEWFAKASQCGIDKPHAMTLSTVDSDGRPTARMVLLSSYDERGFVFHTNYESDKARAIAANPNVALVFWWDPLGFQVRIEGRAELVAARTFGRRTRAGQSPGTKNSRIGYANSRRSIATGQFQDRRTGVATV